MAVLDVEEYAPSLCFHCNAPYSGPYLVCGPCTARAYRYAHVDSNDGESWKLRQLASEQRKTRDAKKWQEALDAATGVEY